MTARDEIRAVAVRAACSEANQLPLESCSWPRCDCEWSLDVAVVAAITAADAIIALAVERLQKLDADRTLPDDFDLVACACRATALRECQSRGWKHCGAGRP